MKNKHARAMFLVHDTSPECVLQIYEVSLKYLDSYQVIERTRNSIAYDQRKITQNIQSRVMVLLHGTLSQCALEVYEVSTK